MNALIPNKNEQLEERYPNYKLLFEDSNNPKMLETHLSGLNLSGYFLKTLSKHKTAFFLAKELNLDSKAIL